MGFRVFENGKRCSEYGFEAFSNDTFDTKREAEQFAIEWAYPIDFSKIPFDMELDTEYDMSMTEHPVLMMIVETIENTPENWDNRKLGADERFAKLAQE